MERNTLIKLLSLLQDLITVIIMLKDFQKWELDQKRTMSTFICWTTRIPLLEITTTDGIIKEETWFAILQKLHTRVKEVISGLSTTNHGWDKIKPKEDMLLPLKFNTGLQTKKFSNLVTLTKLLLMNATKEESRSCSAGSLQKSIIVRLARRLPLSRMLTAEKLLNLDSSTETSIHQVSHGKTSSTVVSLVKMVWSMSTHTPFNTKDSKTSFLSVMLSEETSQEPCLHQWPRAQLLKITFLDSWMERNQTESMMDIPISQCSWATLMPLHSLIFMTLRPMATITGNQATASSEIDISTGNKTPTKKLDQPTCQWAKTTDHHTSISHKPSTSWSITNTFKTRKLMSKLLDPFTLKAKSLCEESKCKNLFKLKKDEIITFKLSCVVKSLYYKLNLKFMALKSNIYLFLYYLFILSNTMAKG